MLNKEQKRIWKQVVSMAANAALAEPGKTPTSHFSEISQKIEKMKQTHPMQNLGDEGKLRLFAEIEKLITNALNAKLKSQADFFEYIHLTNDVRSIINYAKDIVECRDIIRNQTGLLSVESLHRPAMIFSQWIALDLLSYCWNNGIPYCPDMLGMLISMVHYNGGQDGGCVEYFGTDKAVKMLEAASPEGFQYISPPIKRLEKPVKAYRACLNSSPKEAASGITWRLDLDRAVGWARDPFSQEVTSPIIYSVFHPDDILVSIEDDQEIVVYPNSERPFKMEQSVSVSKDGSTMLEGV